MRPIGVMNSAMIEKFCKLGQRSPEHDMYQQFAAASR